MTKEEALAIINTDFDNIYYLPKSLFLHKDFVLYVLNNFYPYQSQEVARSEVYHLIPTALQHDKDIIALGWEVEGITMLYYIRHNPILKDKDFWLKALARPYRNITDPGYLYYYLDPSLQQDNDILNLLIPLAHKPLEKKD